MATLRLFFSIMCLAIASFCFSLFYGSVHWQSLMNSYDNNLTETILFKLRLPRTLAGFVSGGLLALSGALMQLLLQNPLADPYVLGISGGAALSTLLVMFLGLEAVWLLPSAWVGSLAAMMLVILLARKHRFQPHTLLLTGIAIGCAFSAAISFILMISPDTNLHSMLFWLAGDLNDAQLPLLSLCVLLLGLMVCYLLAPALNILLRGELPARSLGVNIKQFRIILYFLSSLFTACAVTIAGSIGFVGLVVPHLTRSLLGNDHRITLPATALLGGSLVILADTCARTMLAPQQLPVGILLALIGVPIFIWLLQR